MYLIKIIKKSYINILLAVITSFLLSFDALAFQVLNINITEPYPFLPNIVFQGSAIHEDITYNALPQIESNLEVGQDINFTQQAITGIANANWHSDSYYMNDPVRHFDMENFGAGQSLLVDLRNRIKVNLTLELYEGDDNGNYARKLLGEALHVLQDFYAHSTWVEHSYSSPAPLGETLADGTLVPIPNILSPGPSEFEACREFRGIVLNAPLTSGFYDNSNLVFGSDYDHFSVYMNSHIVKKCGHGSGNKCNNVSLCPNEYVLTNSSGGINKDTPYRIYHAEARGLATQSTINYVNFVLSDLQGKDTAKCKLMGLECFNLFLERIGDGRVTARLNNSSTDSVVMDCDISCTTSMAKVFKSGTQVTLEAEDITNSGFTFKQWSGDCSGNSRSLVIELSSEKHCTAEYASETSVSFYISVDDYVKLYIDGGLVASYDNYPWGEARTNLNLTQGWHDIRLDYKNRYGSTAFYFYYKYPNNTDYLLVPRSALRTIDAQGNYISGLKANYTNGQIVYGEAPIAHGWPSVYQGQSSSTWGGFDVNWGIFGETLTGQIYIQAP